VSLPAKNFHLRFLHLMIIYQVQPVTDAASQAALRKVVIAGSTISFRFGSHSVRRLKQFN